MGSAAPGWIEAAASLQSVVSSARPAPLHVAVVSTTPSPP
jgi:hypothetical protein